MSERDIPDPIYLLGSLDSPFFEAYISARDAVMEDAPGGLSRAEKELILMVLDVVSQNEEAAVFHGRHAMRLGAEPRALLEALLLTFLVGGAATWGTVGYRAFSRCVGEEA